MNIFIYLNTPNTRLHRVFKIISIGTLISLILSIPVWLFPLSFIPPSGGSGFVPYYLLGFFIIFLSLIFTLRKPYALFGIIIGIAIILGSVSYDRKFFKEENIQYCQKNPQDSFCINQGKSIDELDKDLKGLLNRAETASGKKN